MRPARRRGWSLAPASLLYPRRRGEGRGKTGGAGETLLRVRNTGLLCTLVAGLLACKSLLCGRACSRVLRPLALSRKREPKSGPGSRPGPHRSPRQRSHRCGRPGSHAGLPAAPRGPSTMDGPQVPHKRRGLLRQPPDAGDELDVARAGAAAGGRALRDVHGVPLRVRRPRRRRASESSGSSQSAHGGAAEIHGRGRSARGSVAARACVHESKCRGAFETCSMAR